MAFPKDGGPTGDAVLYWLMLIVGSVPVTWAVLRHAVWGVEPTLGMLLVAAGLLGLVRVALTPRADDLDESNHRPT